MTDAITRILVPVDFSPHSDRALRYATRLAARLGASVELVHVVDNPFASGAWTSEMYVSNLPHILESLTGEATKRLTTLKSVAASEGVNVETNVLTGQPAHTIIEHAHAGSFDLIVMGTHGRTGFSHVFMGSVAERVVRRASCPVLTLREGPVSVEQERPTTVRAVA
ncbi:MAG: universal stress protein [Vicinamibacterales bacterium]